MALARFTSDSIASDSRPTESVMYQASVLSVIVISATAIDAQSRRFGVRKRAGSSPIIADQPNVTRANLRLPTCST